MAERKNLFAYTEIGIMYPGYISVNRLESGDVEVTVREHPTINADCYGHDVICGEQAAFTVPADEWARLVSTANG